MHKQFVGGFGDPAGCGEMRWDPDRTGHSLSKLCPHGPGRMWW